MSNANDCPPATHLERCLDTLLKHVEFYEEQNGPIDCALILDSGASKMLLIEIMNEADFLRMKGGTGNTIQTNRISYPIIGQVKGRDWNFYCCADVIKRFFIKDGKALANDLKFANRIKEAQEEAERMAKKAKKDAKKARQREAAMASVSEEASRQATEEESAAAIQRKREKRKAKDKAQKERRRAAAEQERKDIEEGQAIGAQASDALFAAMEGPPGTMIELVDVRTEEGSKRAADMREGGVMELDLAPFHYS